VVAKVASSFAGPNHSGPPSPSTMLRVT